MNLRFLYFQMFHWCRNYLPLQQHQEDPSRHLYQMSLKFHLNPPNRMFRNYL
jgi:hypothetical protein